MGKVKVVAGGEEDDGSANSIENDTWSKWI